MIRNFLRDDKIMGTIIRYVNLNLLDFELSDLIFSSFEGK